ncbi:arsenical pump-driving ATPase [Reyranella sp.]|uniref:arsenical pump-driving ATPase n=1 Tax=Reyranella sp. TaxID=1929291 RepID=UPI002731D79E|nr:arsenical pump-driving ATPase [Reyranella sp.]MDP2374615.1 arsenical pump-driving ATPase [Reyranella sp.]
MTLNFLHGSPTRFLFFTGKGGVGKTSVACAASLHLADAGKTVLLVSTDPASNLDEMLGVTLSNRPVAVPDAPRLSVLNIDPTAAAEAYRGRVLAQLETETDEKTRQTVREQLSGACTTEIAAFDEFTGLLADEASGFDHVVFDTAPTGHTLRLLSLPKAWTGFLAGNDRGASCLGPHSGLKMQEERFRHAMEALANDRLTTIVLVTRPERGAIREADRTSIELRAMGLSNQHLVVNGVFKASGTKDAVAVSLQKEGQAALSGMPAGLRRLPREEIGLRPYDMVGLDALRSLLAPDGSPTAKHGPGPDPAATAANSYPDLRELIDRLAKDGRGLIMVMGKGGVGKTTIASAIAVGLVERGHSVHLSTTDPAAHLAMTLDGELPGLLVDRIDPKAETARYIAKAMETGGRNLDDAGKALLREDLESPCTEEVAVFHAFSRIVGEARSAFVVLDTAPTGHSLLLMDATGAYHRQMVQNLPSQPGSGRLITPLMRLQDSAYTHVILVTLAETTPVSQAAALQEDLRRASIEPFAWVINKCLVASGTRDPLLLRRLVGERAQIARVHDGLAKATYLLPRLAEPPVGIAALERLAARTAG